MVRVILIFLLRSSGTITWHAYIRKNCEKRQGNIRKNCEMFRAAADHRGDLFHVVRCPGLRAERRAHRRDRSLAGSVSLTDLPAAGDTARPCSNRASLL